MTFKGVLDMRFPGGWYDSTSQECWSYTHLWWIEGDSKISEDNLKENLIKYFFGLSGGNRKNATENKKFVPTTVSLQKIKTAINEIETYSGVINTFDSHVTQRAIKLNYRVHVRACYEQKHTALLIELSPQPTDHKIWKDFQKILDSFYCSN